MMVSSIDVYYILVKMLVNDIAMASTRSARSQNHIHQGVLAFLRASFSAFTNSGLYWYSSKTCLQCEH